MNEIHFRLDLNLLRVLVSIDREGQLNRAAAALNITPSAVSHALRRLREHFQDPLFERDRQRMRPTALCEKMLPEMHDLLARMSHLLERSQDFQPEQTQRTFRIGMPEAVEAELFPQLYRRLAAAAPHCRIESIAIPHAQLPDYLLHRQADVAIDVALPMRSPIQQRPLSQESFVVIRRERDKQQLTREDYLAARHIAVSSRARGTVLEDYLLRELGVERNLAVRVQSYQTAGSLAANSDALLTLPETIADRLITQFSLRKWPVPLPLASTRLQLYWHDAHRSDPGTQWLLAQISSV